ncbi:hypothetical protein RJ639_033696 [Escallonia herrerae]|uniref:Transcription initiation factor TFIID subunit 1 n=1 Tax=Escallonia herrerae TaxID=1293975 RepID=A0AA88WV95_9ASTE|nr:hypothetical protein RJ639_033696 [Escallonia herrerae]
MGYEPGSTSQDIRDEDDEEEYEEVEGGNRLLGFMFGNVDGSGDLDVDYLDEDAKEHLAALADKLGPSFTEIDLSVKLPQFSVDAAEQDYDEKAEDAVDYEDIQEQYEGPEIQAVTEEDYLLPKKDYFPTEVAAANLSKIAVFDDENYDDDEEVDKEQEVVENDTEVQTTSSGEHGDTLAVASQGEISPEDGPIIGTSSIDTMADDFADFQKEEDYNVEEQFDGKGSVPLPILCIEEGKAILRFSEIFGIHESLKKAENRQHRYSVHKERLKSVNTFDSVEEDELEFLMGSSESFSCMRQAFEIQDDTLSLMDDDEELVKSGVVQRGGKVGPEVGGRKKDTCHSAEPMKGDITLDPLMKWNSHLSPEFYPLDQQDWEDRIMWDNSPVLSDNAPESWDISGPDSDSLDDKESEAETRPQSVQPELQMEPNEKDHGYFLHGCPVSVEPFGSRKHSELRNPPSEYGYHPQLLRLESRFENDEPNGSDSRKDGATEEIRRSDVIRRFSKLALQNRDVLEGSWLDKIIWEPDQSFGKTKLILDLQDEQMLFEVLDNKDGKQLQLHAGAMTVTRSGKSNSGDFLEHSHGGPSGGQFNIANDKFYSNRKSSQQLKSHSKKRSAHSVKVLHSIPALKLQTMKAKLSNKDIANFHRPKALWYPHDNEVALKEQGKLPTQGPMKIILKSLGSKGSKLHVDAEETISSVKAKASRKLDFKPSEPVKIFYSGKELEDHESLSVQNVRPNSLLHLVRTKIHILPRAQKLPGENKSLRPPGAFKKKSDLSVKDGHVFLMEYCEERPLLLGNVGMGARLCTYYQKSAPGDQTGTLLRSGNNKLGSVLALDPADKSPFLGDIKAGCSQSCLETNMYRAPIYQHQVPSTDYLLVRSAKGKLSIRRIDRIDVVGQQFMFVIESEELPLRLLVYMYRGFRADEKGDFLPSIRADEVSSQFPSLSEAFLRKSVLGSIAQVVNVDIATQQKGANGQLFWVMRRSFRIPLEEELRRMVTPENFLQKLKFNTRLATRNMTDSNKDFDMKVCAYESMQAGLYRLKRLGVTRLTHPTGLSSAMNQLPDEAIALAAASHIERELQITPWNLSSNFVACTNQDRENIERLEITGVGDPSGRGLGFSYVRTAPKAPISNALVKKKAAVNRGGSTVTGTDADLRRLSMEAAREVLLKFNVPEEQIAKQTRWHRIAMIRKLSSEQAASGIKVDPTTIGKYARGQRMSFLQLQQQTREKCQEIWDRQVQSLSALDGEENESDAEANSDLDSFAGDLENLLDAEECEEGEESNYESKQDDTDGVAKGLKMRRRPFQALAQEEIEDEAAEAAELCRMLMDDEEAERKRKKKVRSLREQVALASHSSFGFENAERVKKMNTVVKQIGLPQPDRSYGSKENAIRDLKEEERLPGRKTLPGKLKAKKKNDIENMGLLQKKVKILGDGIKIKEKKSARESFVCGACGQLGHMRTNKNCPKYREDLEVPVESRDTEKASGKSSFVPDGQPQQKTLKKFIPKGPTKIALVEAPEEEKSALKAKVLKVKCGSTDKLPEKPTPSSSQISDRPLTSDTEGGVKSGGKVGKIILSNKTMPKDARVESQKPLIVIRPPMETDRDHPRQKIIIRQPKEVIDLDQISQEGSPGLEYRKTKRINELSSSEKYREQETRYSGEETSRRTIREDKRWWEEENKRRIAVTLKEERAKRIYEEQTRVEEQEKVAEIRKFEYNIRKEREEEERRKASKKLKKRGPEIRDEYLEEFGSRRHGRRIPERGRTTQRMAVLESGSYGADYAPPTKRRRGGEVGLANILEGIVDILKENIQVSYLFLKPVSKKEAPDYLTIIKRPMDLSTIKEKARRLEYKSRDDFRHDMWQITYNAHQYNDQRNPGIPPLADQLLELCDFLMAERDAMLIEAEASIDEGAA